MIDAFTIVPAGPFEDAVARLEAHLSEDPGALVVPSDGDTLYFFCGDEFVRRALRTMDDQERELTCIRACASAGVLHVSTLGYEASVTHLHTVLAWILSELGPCTVYDDETGEDVSAIATRFPSTLLFPGEEAAEPAAPESDIRSLRPPPTTPPPEFAELAGMIDVPMPGVRSRRGSSVPAPSEPAPASRAAMHPAPLPPMIEVPIPGVRSRR